MNYTISYYYGIIILFLSIYVIVGFITYGTPKQSDKFHLEERYDFLPKGLSPILTKTKPVDTSLSQRTKGKLLEYIMETYKNELLYVKWQNDIKGTGIII